MPARSSSRAGRARSSPRPLHPYTARAAAQRPGRGRRQPPDGDPRHRAAAARAAAGLPLRAALRRCRIAGLRRRAARRASRPRRAARTRCIRWQADGMTPLGLTPPDAPSTASSPRSGCSARGRAGAGGDRRVARDRARRGGRAGRRERLGQEHARPPAARAAAADRRARSLFDGADLPRRSRPRLRAAAPAHADRLPGPVLAASIRAARVGAQIADGLAIHGIVPPAERRRAGRRAARRRSGWPPSMPTAIRTSSPAASASASASRARWRPSRTSWSPTSRSRRSTSRCRRRCCALLADLRARLGLGAAVHQPRPAGGAPSVRPGGGDVSRPGDGGGAGGGRCFATPRHPYTRALLSAAPRLDPAAPARRASCCTASRRARPIRRPAACSARAARMRCRPAPKTVPPLRGLAPGRRVACIRDEVVLC